MRRPVSRDAHPYPPPSRCEMRADPPGFAGSPPPTHIVISRKHPSAMIPRTRDENPPPPVQPNRRAAPSAPPASIRPPPPQARASSGEYVHFQFHNFARVKRFRFAILPIPLRRGERAAKSTPPLSFPQNNPSGPRVPSRKASVVSIGFFCDGKRFRSQIHSNHSCVDKPA